MLVTPPCRGVSRKPRRLWVLCCVSSGQSSRQQTTSRLLLGWPSVCRGCGLAWRPRLLHPRCGAAVPAQHSASALPAARSWAPKETAAQEDPPLLR